MGISRRALYTKEATVGSPYGESFILFVYASKSIPHGRSILSVYASKSISRGKVILSVYASKPFRRERCFVRVRVFRQQDCAAHTVTAKPTQKQG